MRTWSIGRLDLSCRMRRRRGCSSDKAGYENISHRIRNDFPDIVTVIETCVVIEVFLFQPRNLGFRKAGVRVVLLIRRAMRISHTVFGKIFLIQWL